MTIRDQFLYDIERFLKRTGIKPAPFGTMVLNDRSFVINLRAGKDVRTRTIEKVRAFMAEYEANQNKPRRSRSRAAA